MLDDSSNMYETGEEGIERGDQSSDGRKNP
jgi:hypothetical protein